jgi:AraC-like DNA-binding protein
MPGGFMAALGQRLGMPGWFLHGTGLPISGPFPPMISVAQYLALVGNILDAGHRSDFVDAAIDGNLRAHLTGVALGMQSAPTLGDGLALLVRHGTDRTGLHRFALHRASGRTELEVAANTDLGRCEAVLAETVLVAGMVYLHSMVPGRAGACAVRLLGEADDYSPGFAARLGCAVQFGQPRNGLFFATAAEAIANPGHDQTLWELGQQRCRSEAEHQRLAAYGQQLFERLRRDLAEQGSVPRLAEIAAESRASTRTLMRQLKAAGLSYQQLIDSVRQERARELLEQGCPVGTTAEALGYADPSSFRRSYLRWYGHNPSAHGLEPRG